MTELYLRCNTAYLRPAHLHHNAGVSRPQPVLWPPRVDGLQVHMYALHNLSHSHLGHLIATLSKGGEPMQDLLRRCLQQLRRLTTLAMPPPPGCTTPVGPLIRAARDSRDARPPSVGGTGVFFSRDSPIGAALLGSQGSSGGAGGSGRLALPGPGGGSGNYGRSRGGAAGVGGPGGAGAYGTASASSTSGSTPSSQRWTSLSQEEVPTPGTAATRSTAAGAGAGHAAGAHASAASQGGAGQGQLAGSSGDGSGQRRLNPAAAVAAAVAAAAAAASVAQGSDARGGMSGGGAAGAVSGQAGDPRAVAAALAPGADEGEALTEDELHAREWALLQQAFIKGPGGSSSWADYAEESSEDGSGQQAGQGEHGEEGHREQ